VLGVGRGAGEATQRRRIERAAPRGEERDRGEPGEELEPMRRDVLVWHAIAREVHDGAERKRDEARPGQRSGGRSGRDVKRDDHPCGTRMRGRNNVRRPYPSVASLLRPGRSRRLVRPLRLIALAYLAVGLLAAVLFRSTIAAQAEAVVVLSAVLDTPVVTWVVEHMTDEPRVEDAPVAGVPATVVRPGGSGPWPVLVFVNGVTPRGRHHPDVQALARGLARAGYLVVVPDPPGLAQGEITVRTLDATAAVVQEATRLRGARARVALLGVSAGGSLALVAAAEPAFASRVSVVAAIAPYADLPDMFRLATIGSYADGGHLVPYDSASYLTLVAARSLVAALPPGRERDELLAALPATREVDEEPPDPLAGLRALERHTLSPDARAVLALLLNREPGRFDELYAALPPRMRAANERLSPSTVAARAPAPIELASAPEDKYFPLAHSHELAGLAPEARVTVTATLEHAVPDASLDGALDLLRFDAFAVRVLERAGG
jgi:pimeloyl-ACP methyl ester carboxylesterase